MVAYVHSHIGSAAVTTDGAAGELLKCGGLRSCTYPYKCVERLRKQSPDNQNDNFAEPGERPDRSERQLAQTATDVSVSGLERQPDQFGGCVQSELLHQICAVSFHGAPAQAQFMGNDLAGLTRHNHIEDLSLTR